MQKQFDSLTLYEIDEATTMSADTKSTKEQSSASTHYEGLGQCDWLKDKIVCSWEKSATFKAGIVAESAKELTLKTMGWGDLLGFLAIIIALSAYLGAIRVFGIQTILSLAKAKDAGKKKVEERSAREKAELERKASLEQLLFTIAFPDIGLILSGVFLIAYIFSEVLFPWPRADWLFTTSVVLFVGAILLLVFYHGYAWGKTFGWWGK